MHTSQFSMGVDVADINNDAYPEIISMDMLPSDAYILKRSLGEDEYNTFYMKVGYGYNYQYTRNNLQLNRRNGRELPFANKAELEKQIPLLKKKFLYADDFAKANLQQLFTIFICVLLYDLLIITYATPLYIPILLLSVLFIVGHHLAHVLLLDEYATAFV